VVDIPSSYGRFRSEVDSSYDAQVRAEAKHQYEQYLQTVTTRFAEGTLEKYHLAVSTVVATDPDVAEAIVQAAEQGKVDCIAMATHGRGGVQHWALGSITERVLHATKVPLFIVRPQGA
jgi:nucleotide-binding universal stress UspA family protein